MGHMEHAYISLGNGDGTFRKYTNLRTGNWHPSLVSVDLNRDGKLDLALTCSDGISGRCVDTSWCGGRHIRERRRFREWRRRDGICRGRRPEREFNSGPGRGEPGTEAGTITVLLGNGDGTFAPKVDYMVSSNALAVCLSDFDGDSALDMAVSASGSNLSILLGIGDGSFQPKVDLAVSTADHNGILAADLNGDSKPDLVVSNSPPMNSVSVFTNSLRGNKPPTALCRNVTVPAGAACMAPAVIDAGSFAPDGTAKLLMSQTPPGPYPLGQTNATLTVTDTHGASSQCSARVTVVDGTPPVITLLSATPGVLWPVNGKMTPVYFSVGVSDSCSRPVTCRISGITSNEPDSPGGDWVITGELTANLRAARSGTGSGRTYTITLECADPVGNKTAKDAIVVVLHDQRK